MNYQYRFGTTTTQAIHTLYADGGWKRYYQGLTAALVQGPVSRFGDTAANAGILALLESNTYMKSLPVLLKSAFASLAAALFRMILTPIDTLKTTLQTQGKPGVAILKTRVCQEFSYSCRVVTDARYNLDKEVWRRDTMVWRHCHRCRHVRGPLSGECLLWTILGTHLINYL
jgi:hypothetical protein